MTGEEPMSLDIQDSIINGLPTFISYMLGSIRTDCDGGSVLRGRNVGIMENPDVMPSPQLVARSRPWKLSRVFDDSGIFRPSFKAVVPNKTRRNGSR